MKVFLCNPELLKCPHSEMTTIIINDLCHLKKNIGMYEDNFVEIAKTILDYVSERVSNPDLLPSYQMFILDKIETAFKIVMKAKNNEPKNTVDESELDNDEMLDIPIEDFQPLTIDEEFDKLIGYNE